MRWTDSHCHLHDPKVLGDGLAGPLNDAANAGVERLITVGCDEQTSRDAITCATTATAAVAVGAIADEIPTAGVEVWATVGCHPHEARLGWTWMPSLLGDAAPNRVVAVGECGLDYHYDYSPRDEQRNAFVAQIAMAHQFELPLVIHTRNAWDDTFAILASEGMPRSTIFHCFTGGPGEAERCLALPGDVYLSFSGIISFPSAADLRAAACVTPAARTLVETDAPYLAPIPFRGRPNKPAYVSHVGAALATATQRDVNAVAVETWNATTAAFALT
jgi:TatD DNase family protein